MPITIREILASDTISGAADKINFNFDQLLLNGGGPPGPPGPQGPIGPIGGRGIRGSVWYEGLGDPNLVPPTLTPEDEDNYLRGDGFVWTYNGSTWVNTTISLIGPVGPAGASGKFAEYQGQPGTYSTAGDTTMFPIPMLLPPAGLSTNTSNLGVRSVIIGGFPGGLTYPPNPMFPSTGDQIIVSTLATQIVQPDVSLFVHQFNSSGGGIKFHGGDAIIDNFTNILGELVEIRLLRDDKLSINVPKAATAPSSVTDVDGLSVTTPFRGQLYQSGKRIQFQTGVSTSGYSSGDTNDFIVDAARNGSGSDPTIQLNVLGTTSAPTAAFRLGSILTPALPAQTGDARLGAGLITINGSTSITETSPQITLYGTQQTNIYAGTLVPTGATGRVTIGASSQIVMRTINSASTGAISISTGDSTTGSISLSTGTTSTGNIGISTSLGAGRVDITSAASGTSPGAINISTTGVSAGNINLVTANASPGDIAISTSSGSGRVNITSGANTSGSLEAINLLTDAGSAGAIQLATGTTSTGNIQLQTGTTSTGNIGISTSLGAGRVDITSRASNSMGLGAINIITDALSAGKILISTGFNSLGNIEISTSAGTGDIILTSGDDVSVLANNNITLSNTAGPVGNIFISAVDDVVINHGIGDQVTIQPISGNSDATIEIKPAGANTQSNINVWGDSAATTTNLQLRSDSSANEGSITVASGMDLRLINDGAAIGDRIRVIAGNTAPPSSVDPRFAVNAANHYTYTLPIQSLARTNIFSSGQMSYPSIGNWNSVIIAWQRCGDVVTCSGLATSLIGAGTIIPYPIKGFNTVNFASGVWVKVAGSGDPSGYIIQHVSGDHFDILPVGAMSGSTVIRFSFSYVIL